MNCRGLVQEGGVKRPCQKTGNAVLANGFCANHQYLAVLAILERLRSLEVELSRLEQMPSIPADPGKIALLRKQIEMLKEEMNGARQICSANQDCSLHLRDMLVTLRDVTESTPYMVPQSDTQHPLNAMRSIEGEVSGLATGTSFEDAQAFSISKEYELARRQQREVTDQAARLQTQLTDVASGAEQQERKFQQRLQVLTQELKSTEQQKAQADQVLNSLQMRLDRCQAESKNVSAVYSQTIDQQKQELDAFKARYNDMIGREIRATKSLDVLTKNERELQKAVEELKQSYESKLSKLRDQYASQSAAAGGTLLSEREEALQRQVEELKSDLAAALEDLKLATSAGQKAMVASVTSQQPHAQVARELVDVNATLQSKNEELAKLRAVHDRKMAEFAQLELKTAQRIDHATAADRNKIQQLQSELAGSERRVASVQQEVVNLQTASYELRRKHENEVAQITGRLREVENHLMQTRAQRDAERNALQQAKQAVANEREMLKSDMDFKFNQMKDSLQQNYADRLRQLKAASETSKLQIDQERKNLIIAQRQQQEQASTMEINRRKLDSYRMAYDQKMADFYNQKQSLETTLSQAKAQANQFAQLESDYRKRIDILRQSVEVQRQRYEAQIAQLTQKLNATMVNRNQIQATLEKCSAARDSMIQRVNMLTDENSRLKDMYLQMKTRLDMTRTQYEAHMEKLRAEAVNMQNDIRSCAQRLQDATLVHDHVKRIKQEAQDLRTNMEEQIRAAKGNEQALQRLLRDREVERNQALRLQSALKECAAQRSQVETGLQSTNAELRDVKRMHAELASQVQGVSDEYKRALQQRDATLAQQQIQQQVREDSLRKQLAEVQGSTADKSEKIARLEQQRRMISESLANTEVERAAQIRLLVDSQRASAYPGALKPASGSSSLISQ